MCIFLKKNKVFYLNTHCEQEIHNTEIHIPNRQKSDRNYREGVSISLIIEYFSNQGKASQRMNNSHSPNDQCISDSFLIESLDKNMLNPMKSPQMQKNLINFIFSLKPKRGCVIRKQLNFDVYGLRVVFGQLQKQ